MGMIFLIGYILLVGLGTFLMKFVHKDLTSYQINFLIAIGMLLVTLPMLLLDQKSLHLPAKGLPLAFISGLCMAIGSILFVASLRTVDVGPASAIAGGYIVFALILSVVFLKEPLDFHKIAGLLLTLAGITILSFKST